MVHSFAECTDCRSQHNIYRADSSELHRDLDHSQRFDDYWPLLSEPGSELDRVLSTAHSWDFDVYALDAAADGHALSVLAFWLLQKSGLIQELGESSCFALPTYSSQTWHTNCISGKWDRQKSQFLELLSFQS